MTTIKPRNLLVLAVVLTLSPVFAGAVDKAKICNAEKPVWELLKAYSSESISEDLNSLYVYSAEHPMENADWVQSGLATELADYRNQLQNKERLNSVFKQLNTEAALKLRPVITEYVHVLQNGRNEILYDLADQVELTQEQRNVLGAERAIALRESLMAEYGPKMMLAMDNSNIATEVREYVVKWVFIVLPDDVQYDGGSTDEAAALHRHVWDLVYDSGIMSATKKVANGFYWLQTTFNHEHPGLTVGIALRNEKDLHKSLNVTLHFSPFLDSSVDQENYATVCDFSEDLNSCEKLSFKDWCGSEG